MGLKLLLNKMIINVKVVPCSNCEKLEKISSNGYKIHVKERAEDNAANIKVINILAKELGVSFRKIRIKNLKSREKIVEITEE